MATSNVLSEPVTASNCPASGGLSCRPFGSPTARDKIRALSRAVPVPEHPALHAFMPLLWVGSTMVSGCRTSPKGWKLFAASTVGIRAPAM